MKSLALFTSLLFSILIQAQVQPEWKTVLNNINEEVQKHSEAYQKLKQATETIGHRLTGTENGTRAEQLAFDLLKSYGFDEVKFQPFTVESWMRGSVKLEIGTGKKQLHSVKSVALAHTPLKSDEYAEIIDVGNGLEEDYQNKNVKGKIVLIYLGVLPGYPQATVRLHRSEKAAIAIQKGAKGVIFFNQVPGGVLLTGTASVTGKLISIPAVCIGYEDGMSLKEELKKGKQYAHVAMENKSEEITARNVIATLKGSEFPDEKIVVGGHLDSWDLATGAIDNGIGSFSVIDMARTFKVLNLKPRRTVEFVLFMGEEVGLLGSKAYVTEAKKDGNINKIRYMLNYDMSNDPKSFSSSLENDKTFFTEIGKIVQEIDPYFKNNFDYKMELHSDHQPFMLQGIPIAGGADEYLGKEVLNCYHADCDTFKWVDEQGMKNTVRFNSMLIYALADAANLPSYKLTEEEIKNQMIQNNLEKPLRLEGEWRW